ncbi:GGDEF domain-containing protein [Sphingomonas mucosissima]|uniref:Putative diguanylate cyclase YfiN n=1 Tax=Sphingomonas mucosissima TaxID=370959 RepID=A0A245ZFI8_9SPHN|nr:GGDEF domain-containing protein [Sphingomonas mucosissima]OWK28504.1 putative diguanylate cyclase YfiN [Sphingomonas mucosissima]
MAGDLGQQLPGWSVTRWLVEPGGDIPDSTRRTLLRSLYSTLPIFAGGVLNTIAVSTLIAARMQTTAAYVWVALEVLLAALRLPTLYFGHKAMREGKRGPTDLYITLAVLWAASVGYGTFMCVASGDWVAATLACLSAAAMVGGICFRNFGAPRLVAVMIALSLGPCVIAGVLSGQPILLLTLFQIPFYLASMTSAAFQLNRLLVRTMKAEMINDHHARHDPLTGLLNRNGLSRWAGEHAARAEAGLAVLYLDLDWFKTINDTLGHKAGDAVLVAVSKRLQEIGGPHVRVARIGGDEFVLVAENIGRDGAEQLKARISEAVAGQAYVVAGQNVHVGASIGVALSDDHGGTLSELLDVADMALHHAKTSNRAAWPAMGRGGAEPAVRRRALRVVHAHTN